MILEMHDNETGNSLMAIIRHIDYDHQAEQWVLDLLKEAPTAVRWILFSADGTPLRTWERRVDEAREIPLPTGVVIDPRSLQPKP